MIFNWGKKVNTKNSHDDEEMTMEEILASIRRYVSEESDPKMVSHPIQEEEETVYKKPKKADVASLKSELHDANPVELMPLAKAAKETPAKPSGAPTIAAPKPVRSAPMALHTEEQMEEVSEEQSTEEHLSSEETFSASAAALSRLMEATKSSKAARASTTNLTLDQLIAELTRPMVKEWLDKNLPSLVEQLVSQEIQKITQQLTGDQS